MEEIFIKDGSFLPELVDIEIATKVAFMNEDNVKHVVLCKGNTSFGTMTLAAGSCQNFTFNKLGKYELSMKGRGDVTVSRDMALPLSRLQFV
jgi:plastocyanin